MRVSAQNPKEDLVKQDVGLPAEKTDFSTEGNGAVSPLDLPALFLMHDRRGAFTCGARCVFLPNFLSVHFFTHSLVHHRNLMRDVDFVQGAGDAGGEVKIASLQDYESYPRAFVVRRLVVFVGIVIGYAFASPHQCCCCENTLQRESSLQ